jgi:hypothetical protein
MDPPLFKLGALIQTGEGNFTFDDASLSFLIPDKGV